MKNIIVNLCKKDIIADCDALRKSFCSTRDWWRGPVCVLHALRLREGLPTSHAPQVFGLGRILCAAYVANRVLDTFSAVNAPSCRAQFIEQGFWGLREVNIAELDHTLTRPNVRWPDHLAKPTLCELGPM